MASALMGASCNSSNDRHRLGLGHPNCECCSPSRREFVSLKASGIVTWRDVVRDQHLLVRFPNENTEIGLATVTEGPPGAIAMTMTQMTGENGEGVGVQTKRGNRQGEGETEAGVKMATRRSELHCH